MTVQFSCRKQFVIVTSCLSFAVSGRQTHDEMLAHEDIVCLPGYPADRLAVHFQSLAQFCVV